MTAFQKTGGDLCCSHIGNSEAKKLQSIGVNRYITHSQIYSFLPW